MTAVSRVRRISVPTRKMDDLLIVARPADGGPVVLAPTARLVWSALHRWRTIEDLGQLLATSYPDVDPAERSDALSGIIDVLTNEGLVDRD